MKRLETRGAERQRSLPVSSHFLKLVRTRLPRRLALASRRGARDVAPNGTPDGTRLAARPDARPDDDDASAHVVQLARGAAVRIRVGGGGLRVPVGVSRRFRLRAQGDRKSTRL